MLNPSFTQSIEVTKFHTAEYLGSGTLAVFATPAMVAFMENTAMKCLTNLPEGCTSVGIAIKVNHIKAIPIGMTVNCTAKITAIDGRKYSFYIRVADFDDNLVGEGTHERVVVDRVKFMGKL